MKKYVVRLEEAASKTAKIYEDKIRNVEQQRRKKFNKDRKITMQSKKKWRSRLKKSTEKRTIRSRHLMRNMYLDRPIKKEDQ